MRKRKKNYKECSYKNKVCIVLIDAKNFLIYFTFSGKPLAYSQIESFLVCLMMLFSTTLLEFPLVFLFYGMFGQFKNFDSRFEIRWRIDSNIHTFYAHVFSDIDKNIDCVCTFSKEEPIFTNFELSKNDRNHTEWNDITQTKSLQTKQRH